MLALTLAAALTAQVPVLAHDVQRGDLLAATDFMLEERAAPLSPLPAPAQILGKEALRRLAAGTLVRPTDVAEPRLVKRGEPVEISIRDGNLVIQAPGRALADGRRGDLLRVVANPTNRTLDAIVDGTGSVRLGAAQ